MSIAASLGLLTRLFLTILGPGHPLQGFGPLFCHPPCWRLAKCYSALGLHLFDWEFRLCLQYWLGLRMVEEGYKCPVCLADADAYGDHQVGCGGNGDRIHCHDSIRDALFSSAQTAAPAPRKEVPSLILVVQQTSTCPPGSGDTQLP